MSGEVAVPASGYDAVYENNVDAGTATMTVTGKGNYTGTATATFAIAPASIAKAKVTLGRASYACNGRERRPGVTSVVLGDHALRADADYVVSYRNNTKPGIATVTITGTGNYADTVKATFSITLAKARSLSTAGHPSKGTLDASWRKVASATSY